MKPLARLTLFFSLLVIFSVLYFKFLLAWDNVRELERIGVVEEVQDSFSGVYIILYILISTALVFLLIKLGLFSPFIFFVEVAVLILSSFVLLESAGFPGEYSLLTLPLIFIREGVFRELRMFILCLGSGLFLAFILPPGPLLFFLLALSLYDIVSVFFTKHMLILAKEVSRFDTSMVLSYGKPSLLKKPRSMREVKTPGIESVSMGAGDLIIPPLVIFSFSRLTSVAVVGIAVGILFSYLILVYALLKYKMPLPAIPFLTFGVLLGLPFSFI